MEKILSIIIPVYNLGSTENYVIKKCIDSFYAQIKDRDDVEILLINDGSTDDSLEIIKEYAKNNNSILCVDKENGGVSSARNAGLKIAKGQYICFIDGDDYVADNYIDFIVSSIKKLDLEMLCFNYYKTDGNTNKIELKMKDEIIVLAPHDGLKRFLNFEFQEIIRPFVWNKVFRKKVIDEYNLQFDERKRIGEDTLFTVSYLERISKIKVVAQPYYYYFERKGSVMRRYNEFHTIDSIQYFESFQEIAFENKYCLSNHDLIAFYISRWFGLINNESKGKNFKKGISNLKTFLQYPYFVEHLHEVDFSKLNIKLKS